MSSGNTFVDDPQMSVRDKYKDYCDKTNKSRVLSESSIDSVDSLAYLDQSFADILKSNAHVTLIRKNIKEKESALKNMDNEVSHSRMAGPPVYNKSPPTRLKSDDSFEYTANDWLNNVSDESFLRVEKECESPTEKDTTILLDIEEPSFLAGISAINNTFNTPVKSVSVYSPLSTITEEATVKCINFNYKESDDADSLSLTHKQSVPSHVGSYRASLVNVFPTKRRVGFLDHMDKTSSNESAKQKTPNEKNSILLINFADSVSDQSPEFDDTLEAVDYFCSQGKRFLDSTCSTSDIV